jgi:hypothetical protein
VSVKKEESLVSKRFQNSVLIKCIYQTGYNWKDLILKAIYELAAFFGFNHIDFRFFFTFIFFLLGYLGIFGKNIFFFFFFFDSVTDL